MERNQLLLRVSSLQIIFKSPKAGGCTRFSADIEGVEDGAPAETTCIHRNDHELIDHAPITPLQNISSVNNRKEEKMAVSTRALNPGGYK